MGRLNDAVLDSVRVACGLHKQWASREHHAHLEPQMLTLLVVQHMFLCAGPSARSLPA